MSQTVFDRSSTVVHSYVDKAKNDPTTRRALLLGAAGVGALGIGAAVANRKGALVSTVAGDLDPAMARDLGEGFYLIDGWVMTADDLGLKAPKRP